MGKFYVYQLRRSDRDQPFYVGKGHGLRAWEHLKNKEKHNIHKWRTIQKAYKESVEILVEIVFDGLSEDESFIKEIELIKKLGRRCNGGPLTNMTDGGEGVSGLVHTDETITLLRERGISQWADPIKRKAWSEYKKNNPQPKPIWTDEARENMANMLMGNSRRKGQSCSDLHKKRIGDSNRGRIVKVGICEYCKKTCSLSMLGRWHNEKCKERNG